LSFYRKQSIFSHFQFIYHLRKEVLEISLVNYCILITKKVNKENNSFYTSSVETSKKQYANYHKDIEKSAETAKSRTFLLRGDDEC
jgi:hypothetical protein